MADAVSAEEWVKRARRLDDAARHHKREEGRHRRAAQQARQQLADLTRECERLGITISIQKTGEGLSPWPKTRSSISAR
jgi:predicted TIM-barrel fold metal-dependent hydrolase